MVAEEWCLSIAGTERFVLLHLYRLHRTLLTFTPTCAPGLTRATRFQAALALDPLPASKVQCVPLEIADSDTHNIGCLLCRCSKRDDTAPAYWASGTYEMTKYIVMSAGLEVQLPTADPALDQE